MLCTILARLSNDEQRVQLLQTLRNKLSHYQLDWTDVKNIVGLFTNKDQVRFDVLQLLLRHTTNSSEKIGMEQYARLVQQSTNGNEHLQFYLFEQIYERLDVRTHDECQRLIDSFRNRIIRQKVEALVRSHPARTTHETSPIGQSSEVGEQCASSAQWIEQTTANCFLPPTSSSVDGGGGGSSAPLQRQHAFDVDYQDECCQQLVAPSSAVERDEYVRGPVSASASDSSLSSASDECVPLRSRSFMLAIKSTFERLKETSS